MSEMQKAVINMPYRMAMESELSRRQYYSRAKECLLELEESRLTIEQLRAQIARDKQFATEAMQANQLQLVDLELFELAEKREAVKG